MLEEETQKATAQLLTAQFSVAGVQTLEIDGVTCDEASLLSYR